jgi:hypothetical protein
MNDTPHRQAMALSDQALIAKNNGELERAIELTEKALELEKAEAFRFADQKDYEPTRSVLFRSAAVLALECGKNREAEQLACEGLAGNPPSPIAEELRSILDESNFKRHLNLNGVILGEESMQVSFAGNALGVGLAPVNIVQYKISQILSVIYRTVERLMKCPFREGELDRKTKALVMPFMSPARVGSYAFTLKVGTTEENQTSFPGMSFGEKVLNELLDCVELVDKKDVEGLSSKIRDERYLRNFKMLAKTIAPDGNRITTVGFTALKQRQKREVALRTALVDYIPSDPEFFVIGQPTSKVLYLEGILKAANDKQRTRGIIELVDDKGEPYKIVVPKEAMNDIVRPHFNQEVMITVKCEGKKFNYIDIKSLEE